VFDIKAMNCGVLSCTEGRDDKLRQLERRGVGKKENPLGRGCSVTPALSMDHSIIRHARRSGCGAARGPSTAEDRCRQGERPAYSLVPERALLGGYRIWRADG